MFTAFNMKRLWALSFIFVLFIPLMMTLPSQAHAQSLDDMRANGQIGEAYDGYARARDGSVQAMVNTINAKRKAIYMERAQQQGISADKVGAVYATKIIANAPAGTWLLTADGQWRQK